MPDKEPLWRLLFEAKQALTGIPGEKAAAWARFYAEVDKARAGTPYSRDQLRDYLEKDGYKEYARRRRLLEQPRV